MYTISPCFILRSDKFFIRLDGSWNWKKNIEIFTWFLKLFSVQDGKYTWHSIVLLHYRGEKKDIILDHFSGGLSICLYSYAVTDVPIQLFISEIWMCMFSFNFRLQAEENWNVDIYFAHWVIKLESVWHETDVILRVLQLPMADIHKNQKQKS